MLMPIVSMNKMAMNESVAATCCYHEQASSTNVFWEVLHGGWIGAGYVKDLVWTSNAYKSWASLGYDLVLPKGYNLANLLPLVKETQTVTATDGTVTTQTVYSIQGAGDMYGWLQGEGISLGACCSHDSVDCDYRDEEISYQTNRHFGATSAHAKITKWSEAHTPAAFNS